MIVEKIVFNTDMGLFGRYLITKNIPLGRNGKFCLPRSHFSAGWMDRVWGIDWEKLPFIRFPTETELKNSKRDLRKYNKFFEEE